MAIPANTETEALAKRLAALRGQSVEEAVITALRAELMREEQQRQTLAAQPGLTPAQHAKVKRIMAMVKAAGPIENENGDPTAFLYDEQGLPH
jgi:hypothetical protein